MIAKKIAVLWMMGCILLLSGCAENVSPNVYDARDAGRVNRVVPAVVVAIRPVAINATTGVGTGVGVAAGAVAGSAIGGNTRTSLLGGIGGAVAGGLLGHAIEKGVNTKQGMEYVLRLRNGSMLTVTQGADLNLGVGQKVFIIYGRKTRIIAASEYGG